MKKIILIAFVSLFSLTGFAQGFKSAVLKGGVQIGSDITRGAIGAEGHYYFTEKFRMAPELTYLFPVKHTTGLDLGVNCHYLINIDDSDKLSLYPILGMTILNNRTKLPGDKAHGVTDFGLNLGAGIEIKLSDKFFFSGDAKYMFSDVNSLGLMAGIGFKFND